MLSAHVRQRHMAELLVIIKILQLKINHLALTVLSDLDSMFMSFKIKNKVNLSSKLILKLIF